MWSVVAFQPWCTIDREPSISKYWVSRRVRSGSASSNVGRQAGAVDRLLGDPVDCGRRLEAGRVEDGRHEVDHVGELRADLAPRVVGMPAGQWTISGVRVPPSQV